MLQAKVEGTITAYTAHIVWVPLPGGAISDGCKENSRFTIEGFAGSLILVNPSSTTPITIGSITIPPSATVPVLSTQPGQTIDATMEVHFGTGPSNPLLTFRSTDPVLFLGTPVQFVQMVGGRIVQAR